MEAKVFATLDLAIIHAQESRQNLFDENQLELYDDDEYEMQDPIDPKRDGVIIYSLDVPDEFYFSVQITKCKEWNNILAELDDSNGG